MPTPNVTGVARFGAFEFDLSSQELRKGRSRLRLPDQSLAILTMLLERPGELVTREAIQARLWPNGTVVDFEHGVNSAVKRLRRALSDTATTPRYVETLPRRGYRFIGTVEASEIDQSGLTTGTIISHYRILAEAGRGAMGVVYKAEDLDLGRMVALKFLSEDLATHPPALERLRREARMIAALNHPGICTMYELAEASGRIFLVMEYLEGETLRERMLRKPLSASELLDVAVRVAKSLEAAHGEGMLHRDIKPDNLFLTTRGAVKLMDFGLAKPVEEEDGSAHQSTLTGTSGYMSPEQMRGEPLDARSDIYSLGKVLEELAGESPPKGLAPILNKALEDDPGRRWQSAGELRGALQASHHKKLPRVALIISAASLALASVVLVAWFRFPIREDLTPVPLATLPGGADMPSFSPDGNRVVFVYTTPPDSHSAPNDKCGIYVKQVGGGPPVRLTAEERDFFPAWSPDDRNIAYIRRLAGHNAAVVLVPAIGGGSGRELARMDVSTRSRISWTPDARWLILSAQSPEDDSYGIWRISADTGERRRVLPAPQRLPNRIDAWEYGDIVSALSPSGRALVFARSLSSYRNRVYAVRMTPEFEPAGPIQAVNDQIYVDIGGFAWASEREIVFSVLSPDGGLFRAPVFGPSSTRRLNFAPGYTCSPAISRNKLRMVYADVRDNQDLWRLDLRTGEYRLLIGSSYVQQIPQYSPDGGKIAFQSDRSGTLGLWTCDAEGENCQQIAAFRGSVGGSPRWSPDGRFIVYDSRADGPSQIYVIPANGGAQRRITSGDADNMVPSWSRDGHWIYFSSNRSGAFQIWKAPLDGGGAVQVTRTGGDSAFESADGRSLYFKSERRGESSLFQTRVDGFDEKRVGPVLSWASFSVTTKGVYFLSDATTLQFLDERSGQTRTLARLQKHSATQGITVSPDGAYLVFSDEGSGRTDLVQVEGFR